MKLIISILLSILLLSSCNKCETCTYTSDTGEKVESSESCGSKNKREEFKKSLEEQWGNFGDVNCTEI